jgi:hypothetical protein
VARSVTRVLETAAFALQFDEQNPGHATALKEPLGHSRIETTMTYLRRKDRAKARELGAAIELGRPKSGRSVLRENRGMNAPSGIRTRVTGE